jgi:hypothetical protein
MLTQDQTAFIQGRIHAIKNRLEKAQRRVERAPVSFNGKTGNVAEAERAHRLSKVLWLHENQPEEAILLYNKE